MILILGGTSESKELAYALEREGFSSLYASTTDLIGGLPEAVPRIIGRFDEDGFSSFLRDRGIDAVIDATHPFAEKISKLAVRLTKEAGIKYARFEREKFMNTSRYIKRADSLKDAVSFIKEREGNILSTIGVRKLPELIDSIKTYHKKIYVRVLPIGESIETCRALGFHSSRIIAAQGPFSKEFNIACINHSNASVVLSKDSGSQGGMHNKLRACEETGAQLVIINRPEVEYPEVFTTTEDILSFLRCVECEL